MVWFWIERSNVSVSVRVNNSNTAWVRTLWVPSILYCRRASHYRPHSSTTPWLNQRWLPVRMPRELGQLRLFVLILDGCRPNDGVEVTTAVGLRSTSQLWERACNGHVTWQCTGDFRSVIWPARHWDPNTSGCELIRLLTGWQSYDRGLASTFYFLYFYYQKGSTFYLYFTYLL